MDGKLELRRCLKLPPQLYRSKAAGGDQTSWAAWRGPHFPEMVPGTWGSACRLGRNLQGCGFPELSPSGDGTRIHYFDPSWVPICMCMLSSQEASQVCGIPASQYVNLPTSLKTLRASMEFSSHRHGGLENEVRLKVPDFFLKTMARSSW